MRQITSSQPGICGDNNLHSPEVSPERFTVNHSGRMLTNEMYNIKNKHKNH